MFLFYRAFAINMKDWLLDVIDSFEIGHDSYHPAPNPMSLSSAGTQNQWFGIGFSNLATRSRYKTRRCPRTVQNRFEDLCFKTLQHTLQHTDTHSATQSATHFQTIRCFAGRCMCAWTNASKETRMHQKRLIHSKKDRLSSKETVYIKRDLYAWKETCIHKKRPRYVQKDQQTSKET